jgi:hypothetical protein
MQSAPQFLAFPGWALNDFPKFSDVDSWNFELSIYLKTFLPWDIKLQKYKGVYAI